MRKALLCLILVAVPAFADSLIDETKQMTLHGNWDAAVAKLQPAIADAGARHDLIREAVLRTELGRVLADRNFFRHSDAARALGALEAALRAAKLASYQPSIADATQYLGQVQFAEAFRTQNWDEPRRYFLRAISLRERLADKRGLAESYFYLGLTYEQQKQPGTAMRHYQHSLALSNEIADKVLQSYAHRHIGGLEEEQGRLDDAFANISKSLELREQAGFTVAVPYALMQKAEFIAKHYGQRDQAIALLEQAIDGAESAHSTRALSDAQSSLARLQMEKGEPREAVSFLECALDNAREFGDPDAVSQTEKQLAESRRKL